MYAKPGTSILIVPDKGKTKRGSRYQNRKLIKNKQQHGQEAKYTKDPSKFSDT